MRQYCEPEFVLNGCKIRHTSFPPRYLQYTQKQECIATFSVIINFTIVNTSMVPYHNSYSEKVSRKVYTAMTPSCVLPVMSPSISCHSINAIPENDTRKTHILPLNCAMVSPLIVLGRRICMVLEKNAGDLLMFPSRSHFKRRMSVCCLGHRIRPTL